MSVRITQNGNSVPPTRSGPVSPPNARPMSFSSWRVSRPFS